MQPASTTTAATTTPISYADSQYAYICGGDGDGAEEPHDGGDDAVHHRRTEDVGLRYLDEEEVVAIVLAVAGAVASSRGTQLQSTGRRRGAT